MKLIKKIGGFMLDLFDLVMDIFGTVKSVKKK